MTKISQHSDEELSYEEEISAENDFAGSDASEDEQIVVGIDQDEINLIPPEDLSLIHI